MSDVTVSRKFALAVLAMVGALAMRYFGMIDGAQWVAATVGTLTVYSTANVAQKATVGQAAKGSES